MSKLTGIEVARIFEAMPTNFSTLDFAKAIESAVLSRAIPEGFKLVPIKPTPEMMRVYEVAFTMSTRFDGAKVFAAMCAAAPSPQETP